jgi:hypothetical protein
MSFKLHYLIPDPAGPIESGPGGSTFKIGSQGRYRIACNAALELNQYHRGTGEPYAVVCDACRATEAFRKNDRPRPSADQIFEYADPKPEKQADAIKPIDAGTG